MRRMHIPVRAYRKLESPAHVCYQQCAVPLGLAEVQGTSLPVRQAVCQTFGTTHI